MVNEFIVKSAITLQTDWESIAHQCFSKGPVGVMEMLEDKHTIFARVVGFVDDPTYGRLIQIERVDQGGRPSAPIPENG